jgi:AbrB family looped-hinge helix DNA binding protein
MRINSKGQVTIPARLREKYNLHEGDEVDVIEVGDTLQIVRRSGRETRGQRLVRRLRGAGSGTMSTSEIMQLIRGDEWTGK